MSSKDGNKLSLGWVSDTGVSIILQSSYANLADHLIMSITYVDPLNFPLHVYENPIAIGQAPSLFMTQLGGRVEFATSWILKHSFMVWNDWLLSCYSL